MNWFLALRSRRLTCNLLGAAACAALLGYALYTQFYMGLEPCPLCIFQRIAVAALGVTFVLAALVPVRARVRSLIAMALIGLVALAGAGVAARHLYIQSLPADQVPVCGAPLETLMDIYPLFELLRKVLTGSGECARINWTFLGLAMPAWVLICVLALGTFGVLVNWPRRR